MKKIIIVLSMELEGVDVMKDKDLKLDEIESSHTKWSVKGSCPGKREVERGDVFLFYFILL
jgi:hypothetical protein